MAYGHNYSPLTTGWSVLGTRCACATFRGEWLLATTYPESIALTTCSSKRSMFSTWVQKPNSPSLLPTVFKYSHLQPAVPAPRQTPTTTWDHILVCNLFIIIPRRYCTSKWQSDGLLHRVKKDKVPCTLGWPYTEGTWLYCDYFIWCVSCTVVVLTCFVMRGCVYVWVL